MSEPEVVPNVDHWVESFVALRDKLRDMEVEYDKKKKPVRDALDQIEGRLMAALEATGSEAIRTAHGTCHTVSRTKASLADPEAFMQYVIANKAFDLLDRKANSTAVKAFVKEKNTLPPGCNLSTIVSIGVRRA